MFRPGTHYPHVTWAHVMLRPGTLSSRHVSLCDVKAGDTLSSRHVSSCDVKAGGTISSRHVSSCDVNVEDTLSSCHVSSCDVKAEDTLSHDTWAHVMLRPKTLSSRHVSLCDVNACSWDVRGDLTLNSKAQIHTSVTAYVTWSWVELWSTHVPARLSNFCCRTHFVRRDVCVERSSDVTSCFQKWRKCLLKKCANRPFYITPSHQIIEISIWEPTHGKG